MKILKSIYSEMFERVPIVKNFVNVDADLDAVPEPDYPDKVRLRFQVRFWMYMIGIEGDANALRHMKDRARRFIAREMYGEAIEDLIKLEVLMMEETYRSEDDKAITAIRNLIRKMEG